MTVDFTRANRDLSQSHTKSFSLLRLDNRIVCHAPAEQHGRIIDPSATRRADREPTRGVDPAPTWRVDAFGGIVAYRRGRPVSIDARSQRRVLSALLIHAPRPVSVAELVDVLWPCAPPSSANSSLQTYIYRLRGRLDSETIRTHPAGYFLDISAENVDLNRFESLVCKASGERASAALALLDAALALCLGRPFGELADEVWARPSTVRIEELVLCAREQRVATLIDLGRIDQALAAAETACLRGPLRERPQALLMWCLARQGRATEALRSLARFRRRLVDETGTSPSSAVADIERAVLEQRVEGSFPALLGIVDSRGASRPA